MLSELRINGIEPPLRHFALLLMVVWVAIELANLSWTIVDQDNGIFVSNLKYTNAESNIGTNPNYNLSSLGRHNIFGKERAGEATPKPKRIEQKITNAPETKLNLTLRGVFAREPGAFALIAIGKEAEELYSVGMKVNPTTTIEAINATSVVLNRNGRLEVLNLADKNVKSSANKGARSTSKRFSQFKGGKQAATSHSSSPSVDYGEYRDRLLKDPQAAMKLAKIQPVMKRGKLAGYRVNPGSDPKLFAQVGLKAGDLVKEINGIQVSDPTKMGDLLKQLTSARELNVTIERNGRLESLSIVF